MNVFSEECLVTEWNERRASCFEFDSFLATSILAINAPRIFRLSDELPVSA